MRFCVWDRILRVEYTLTDAFAEAHRFRVDRFEPKAILAMLVIFCRASWCISILVLLFGSMFKIAYSISEMAFSLSTRAVCNPLRTHMPSMSMPKCKAVRWASIGSRKFLNTWTKLLWIRALFAACIRRHVWLCVTSDKSDTHAWQTLRLKMVGKKLAMMMDHNLS